MALQPCVACNVMIPSTCKTCSCGHVFQGMKQIGGKRFSGYRAQLYSRLESKRMKILTGSKCSLMVAVSRNRENQTQFSKECNKRSTASQRISVHVSDENERKISSEPKPKRLRRSVSPSSQRPVSFHRKDQNPVPAEMIDRLPKALAEINKRLLGQNRMWAGL